MLPKLQQSSLAQSLRKDNPASCLQSTVSVTQSRTSSKILFSKPTMNLINPGRISMPLRTLIAHSVTSPKITYLKKNLRISAMNPTIR